MSRSNYDDETALPTAESAAFGQRSNVVALGIAGSLMSFFVAAFAASGAELKCPALDDLKTPPIAAEIDNLLPRGLVLQQPDKLASAVTLMREHGLSSTNAINHLIALYCPAIASEVDLSSSDKMERVRDFAAQATKAVFANDSMNRIIIDVPLSPDLAEQVKELARHSGMPVDQWIADVVADTARQRP